MPVQTILVVDDDPVNRQILGNLLALNGFKTREAEDGLQAVAAVKTNPPDLVLMDVTMPFMDGLSACRVIKDDPKSRLIPVIILTGLNTMDDRIAAFEAGADEHLAKPYHRLELLTRIRNLTAAKHYTDELENANNVLQSMARIVESRDQYTGDHCSNVSQNAVATGVHLGLTREDLNILRLGGLLHDLGKIAVPDAILHKPSHLDEAEMAIVRTHCVVGDDLVAPLHSMEKVRPLIRSHHERLDGTGYPDGLNAAQISLLVRIMSVADIYEALRSRRSYKESMSHERAIEILKQECDKGWWDVRVVEALAEVLGPVAIKAA